MDFVKAYNHKLVLFDTFCLSYEIIHEFVIVRFFFVCIFFCRRLPRNSIKIVYSADTCFGLYCKMTETSRVDRPRSPLIPSTDKVNVS